MKRMTFLGSVVAGLLVLNISAQDPQPPNFSGVVTGQVLNEAEKPVVKARVCASPIMGWLGPIPCSESDSSGRFTLRIWRVGEYTIMAEKEKAGYPATDNTFYGSPTFSPILPRVIMSEDDNRQEVTVRLGSPFGMLTGKVIDADTGQPIESVRLEVHHANTPMNSIRRSIGYPKGNLRFLVPPVPLIFKITARGYQEWWYGADGSESSAAPLEVGLGATRELAISLRPMTKSN